MTPILSDDLWVLRQFQNVGYRSAIIAGGAVRDSYFDLFPHDIDIFLWAADSGSGEEITNPYQAINEKTLTDIMDLRNVDNVDTDDPFALLDVDFNSFFNSDTIQRMGTSYEGRGGHIDVVYSVYKADFETEYQIIVLNSNPVEYVTRFFDIGLCMCYCDGKRMRYTDAFLADAMQKTLTVCGELTEAEYEHTMGNHVEKMRRRFPDFTVVDKLKGTF